MAHENAHLEHGHRFPPRDGRRRRSCGRCGHTPGWRRNAGRTRTPQRDVGSRQAVATAVARAALALGSQPCRLAMSGSSTMARVTALLEAVDMRSPVRFVTVAASGMAAGALVATAIQ